MSPTVGTKPRRKSYEGTSHADDLRGKFSDSAMSRARKRVGDVRPTLNNTWTVVGNKKMGDVYDAYYVEFNAPKYHCSCYEHGNGDVRARKICSHVLAVILWRKETGWKPVSVEEEGERREDSPQPASEGMRASAIPQADSDPSSSTLTAFNHHPPVQLQWELEGRFDAEQWAMQFAAATEIVECFENGVQVVMLDAPTGSGKTAIADLVARLLKVRGVYVCERKPLQDQVMDDFPYARVLKGRANYTTQHGLSDVTCDDCDMTPGQDDCTYCDTAAVCPYRVAKREALFANLAVLNTAYWLREVNYVGDFAKAGGLLVVDECDTLEDQLHNFVEFRVTTGRCRQLGVEVPKKGSHHTTIATWLREVFVPAVDVESGKMPTHTVIGRRRKKQLKDLRDESIRIAEAIASDAEWVRDNDTKDAPLLMKPVSVAPYGQKYVWSHATRVLMMSATIISPDELAESLGFDGLVWEVVRVPMTFPVENRIVHVAPVANVTAKTKDEAWPLLKVAVGKIMERHPNERILVHTVSYALAQYLTQRCRESGHGRPLLTYSDASQRMAVLEKFRGSKAGVLFASSFERGVDLRGDECSVVVVAKVPFPNLGDPAVARRANSGREGDVWYAVRAIRSLVQMTGRHVRSKEDVGVSYVLDSQFNKNLYRKFKGLFPEWWRDALDTSFPTRELM